MKLQSLNKEHLTQPKGLVNSGNFCYLNALYQSLLSCTSIINVLQKYENNTNNLVSLFQEINNINPKFTIGQQCADEALTLFLDLAKLQPHFLVRYQTELHCPSCGKITKTKEEALQIMVPAGDE